MSVHNIRTEAMQPGDAYVGRRTRQSNAACSALGDVLGRQGYFGNPYKVGQDGYHGAPVARFEEYARERIATESAFRANVRALHGKRLFCWCVPRHACHAEVLERLAAELAGEP